MIWGCSYFKTPSDSQCCLVCHSRLDGGSKYVFMYHPFSSYTGDCSIHVAGVFRDKPSEVSLEQRILTFIFNTYDFPGHVLVKELNDICILCFSV